MDQNKLALVLCSAQERSLIFPSAIPNPAFSDSLNTANYLLYLIKQAGISGLDTEQLISRSSLAFNTVRVFMRELVRLGYVVKQLPSNPRTYALWFIANK